MSVRPQAPRVGAGEALAGAMAIMKRDTENFNRNAKKPAC
ncbi:hypothetical protein SAMN02799624_01044 [Paenibacillus sp. UNC496MF]|nr:hypothetical protein SAMN02799624_01044 [Paenibacillus sp. UNC496MF]